mgnify:CR=1 FL=1
MNRFRKKALQRFIELLKRLLWIGEFMEICEISKRYISTLGDLIDEWDCELQDALTEGKISKEEYDRN